MIDIISDFGEEEVVDCLQVQIDQMKDGSEEIRCTMGDADKDAAGTTVPKEVSLTDPEDFFVQERLDYILEIYQNQNHNDPMTEEDLNTKLIEDA